MFKKQSGAVLVTTMIILFTLTFLVLSSSQSGVVQEKMTAAVRDIHISLEIAESGLKDGEAVVAGLELDDLDDFDSLGKGFYSQDTGPADLFDLDNWKTTNTKLAGTSISGEKAQYFIEHLGLSTTPSGGDAAVTITGYGGTTETVGSEAHVFKIVSRALGKSGSSERILVSYYSKSF